MKKKIENYFNNGLFDEAKKCIDECLLSTPKDMDLLNYQIVYDIYTGNLEHAKELSVTAIKQYPTVGDFCFNYAYIFELEGIIDQAYEYYIKARFLYDKNEKEKIKETAIDEKLEEIRNSLSDYVDMLIDNKDLIGLERLQSVVDREETMCGLFNQMYNSDAVVIGTNQWLNKEEKRFISASGSIIFDDMVEVARHLLFVRGEFLQTKSTTQFIYEGATDAWVAIDFDYIKNILNFRNSEKTYIIRQSHKWQYVYYRISPGTVIESDKEFHITEPIVIQRNPKRKKLVLNIFVDGLAQVILDDQFSDLMPNLYNYFKDAMIFKNAYSTGEWTYPSIASAMSGKDIVNHMCFHPDIDTYLDSSVKMLGEYFKNEGYYTSKIDGEWRSTPRYGCTRGIDRYLYHNIPSESRAHNNLSNVINHIESFKDTDLMLWTCFDDLHNAADGFVGGVPVQANLSLESYSIDTQGATSVKQTYSDKKIEKYKLTAKQIDTSLGMLFSYISANYNEDEVLISVFADHGQGFLVPEGNHFMCKERTNIAFMFKDGNNSFVSDEMVSLTDYTAIMCKLAGIEYNYENTDVIMPKVFGGPGRDYVISESIHPGDEYRATLYTKNYTAYFESHEVINFEGRVRLDNYTIELEKLDGSRFEDKEIEKHVEGIVLERMATLRIYE